MEPTVSTEYSWADRAINQSDVAFAGFYNYKIDKTGNYYRLYSAGNRQFAEAYSEHYVGSLPVRGRKPVDLQKAANLVLKYGLKPAMRKEAIAEQDLQTARGIYQSVKYLQSGGYGDFARIFAYDAETDQLYLNDFGREYLAIGLHEPTFRRPTLGGHTLYVLTLFFHIASLGTIPAVWIDPGETKIVVYNSNLTEVASAHLTHPSPAYTSNWADGEKAVIPDTNQNPHAGGIPEASPPFVYSYMHERGDQLFQK
tara:strand:- start:4743 stop:5507 length:765 start_codon:yes stop_codon:yes gene_type:complete